MTICCLWSSLQAPWETNFSNGDKQLLDGLTLGGCQVWVVGRCLIEDACIIDLLQDTSLKLVSCFVTYFLGGVIIFHRDLCIGSMIFSLHTSFWELLWKPLGVQQQLLNGLWRTECYLSGSAHVATFSQSDIGKHLTHSLGRSGSAQEDWLCSVFWTQ